MKRYSYLSLALLLVTLCGTTLFGVGFAQPQSVPGLRLAGTTYVSLSEVARLLGYSVSEDGNALTVRSDLGILTVFDGSPDALWQPNRSAMNTRDGDFILSAPVVQQGSVWFAPEELFPRFGVAVRGDELVLPGQQTVALSFPAAPSSTLQGDNWDAVALGNNVYGLALYSSGSLGPDTISLMMVDVGLLGLARPELQSELDDIVRELPAGRPLYFVVTGLEPTPWQAEVTFQQGGQSVTLKAPARLSVLSGDTGRVGPGSPALGVMLLPEWVNLRQPLNVEWGGIRATFQFRR